jgi:hypothetical protein
LRHNEIIAAKVLQFQSIFVYHNLAFIDLFLLMGDAYIYRDFLEDAMEGKVNMFTKFAHPIALDNPSTSSSLPKSACTERSQVRSLHGNNGAFAGLWNALMMYENLA